MKSLKIEEHNLILPEFEIVNRILNGEKELYELLMKRNNQKLYRVVRGYFKDSSEIDDIIQNTHLKAFEKLHQFKHNAQYSTWLIRIGINEALSRLKSKGKISNINDLSHSLNNNVMEIPNTNQPNPENKIIRQEAKLFIESTIDCLDSKYKLVFILREVEGMSIREIAECLDLSESNVKVRLHRAKAILKDKLMDIYSSNSIFEFGLFRCDKIVEHVMKRIS